MRLAELALAENRVSSSAFGCFVVMADFCLSSHPILLQ